MPAITIEQAEREGREKGRAVGLRLLRTNSQYLQDFASGDAERRRLRHHFYLVGHTVARQEPEHFGKHDSKLRDEKFETFARAFSEGVMEEARWEAERQGLEVA